MHIKYLIYATQDINTSKIEGGNVYEYEGICAKQKKTGVHYSKTSRDHHF